MCPPQNSQKPTYFKQTDCISINAILSLFTLHEDLKYLFKLSLCTLHEQTPSLIIYKTGSIVDTIPINKDDQDKKSLKEVCAIN
jgi:hypothetical protein